VKLERSGCLLYAYGKLQLHNGMKIVKNQNIQFIDRTHDKQAFMIPLVMFRSCRPSSMALTSKHSGFHRRQHLWQDVSTQ
jgi:hypothetical protein